MKKSGDNFLILTGDPKRTLHARDVQFPCRFVGGTVFVRGSNNFYRGYLADVAIEKGIIEARLLDLKRGTVKDGKVTWVPFGTNTERNEKIPLSACVFFTAKNGDPLVVTVHGKKNRVLIIFPYEMAPNGTVVEKMVRK